MRNDFFIERHAHERHLTYLQEAVDNRLSRMFRPAWLPTWETERALTRTAQALRAIATLARGAAGVALDPNGRVMGMTRPIATSIPMEQTTSTRV